MSAHAIRTAFEALCARDVEPLVGLMHPEMEAGSAHVAVLETRPFLTRPGRGP
jgi:hypothetical protein